jgi:iron complex outermembrane receptor protein
MAISASKQRARHMALAKAGGLALALSMPALLAPAAARAQTIDHSALQQLFGEPVTDSVTGSPQRVSEAPADIEIVTADDIRRSGARDIPGVLRHVAGVDVLQWSNDNADVGVRGYNQAASQRLLVLIDGRQVYADFHNDTVWRTLPVELSEIQQIEIVKGPNSALYGFNAVGGVINIVTRDPLQTQTNAASVTGGTQSTQEGSATMTAKLGDNIGVRLAAGLGRSNDFKAINSAAPPGFGGDDNYNEINLSSQIRLRSNINLSLEATTSASDLFKVSPTYFYLYSKFQTDSIKSGLSIDTKFGLIGISAYRNSISVYSESKDIGNFKFINNTNNFKIDDLFKIGNSNIIRLSAEYVYSNEIVSPITGWDVFYKIPAASGMWNWNITPEISLTNAVRVDYLMLGRSGSTPPGFGLSNADWNRREAAVSYNSGLVWRADDADSFRLMAARGVQVPSLVNLGALLLPTPFGFVSGLPSTSATITDNYEADWERDVPGRNLHLKVGLFHNTSSPTIADNGGQLLSANIISGPVDLGRSTANGLDIEARGAFLSDWRWGASYTPEVITDHFRPGLPVAITYVDFQHTLPVHVVNANLGWAHGPWEIDGYLRYESSFYGIRGGPIITSPATLARIPNYVSPDARIAYRLTQHFTVALSGQNLGQARQIQTSGPPVERRVLVTLSAAY